MSSYLVIRRIFSAWLLPLILVAFSLASTAVSAAQSGLSGRLIVGYQGWFGCPKDFENNKNWQHYFIKKVTPEFITVDLLPSVRGMKPEDLCDTGLSRFDGQGTIKLASSQNFNVVNTHFRWMQQNHIDGVALQRFVSELANPNLKTRRDNVLKNVRKASEENGRVFYITYDISGANPKTVTDDVRKDWRYLVDELKITSNPSYLQDAGKPVLQLWGFGFANRPGTPEEVATLIEDLKNGYDGLQATVLIGGVPTNWRSLPDWSKVLRSYDVVSPWVIGGFGNEQEADDFFKKITLPDLAEAKRSGIRYMPVIFPGFSWYNLMSNRGDKDHAVLNKIPRKCGRFLWRQVFNLLDAKVDMLYAAMFDEVDEGTALFPTETRKDKLPIGANMVYLNQDGCALPDDWYLRVTGKAAEYLRQRQTPPKNLDAVIKP